MVGEEDVEKLTDETIRDGGVLALLYFDVHGSDAEQIKNMLVDLIARITKANGVVYVRGEIDEALKIEGEHITSAEVSVLTKDFSSLVGVCLEYAPFGVEVLRPERIVLNLGEAQSLLLNVSQVSQEYAKFVLSKIMNAEERKKFEENLKKRAELGKMLRERQGERK
ncbi:MAG: hypothetical protein QXP42_01755 [Candidatus Micrarchaeia archaeon]